MICFVLIALLETLNIDIRYLVVLIKKYLLTQPTLKLRSYANSMY